MPTYALPPSTRAVGTANPPADMNSVVDVLNHSVLQRLFYLDQYGADPSGVALSDSAWTACYADAVAAVQAHGGSMIVIGAGLYKFSVNTIAITDSRVGLRGQGRQATTLFTTGNTGVMVKVTGATGPSPQGCSPVTGFTVYGIPAGAGVTGVEYGNRYGGTLTDVSVTGLGGAASQGFWFHDGAGLSEGSFIAVVADQNADDFVFEGTGIGGTGSFDYSHIILKCVSTTAGGQSGTAMKVINGMQLSGCFIELMGNVSATTGLTKTVLQVGVSTSDTSFIQASTFMINVEANTSAGTVKDVLLQGASANTGIIHCNGMMMFQDTSGTYTAGAVTSPAVFTTAGFLHGAFFTAHSANLHGVSLAGGGTSVSLLDYNG